MTEPISPELVERIARKLTKAQGELLFAHDPILDPQLITPAECFAKDCELFVELAPEEYESGCLVYPGDKAWIASMSASSSKGSSDWDRCTISYAPLGLAVREYLAAQGRG